MTVLAGVFQGFYSSFVRLVTVSLPAFRLSCELPSLRHHEQSLRLGSQVRGSGEHGGIYWQVGRVRGGSSGFPSASQALVEAPRGGTENEEKDFKRRTRDEQ
jgi:hypothetical protein